MRLALVAAAIAFVCVCSPSRADTIDTLRLGTTVSGPTHDPKELVGQVVLVEFWGIA